MDRLTIIKVGGAIVEQQDTLSLLLNDFSAVHGAKMLVHGGGRAATRMAERLGVGTQMVNGRRITSADMLDVVTMVYAGLVNKNIVAQLQARRVQALGLTGADADIIRSHRRPPVAIAGDTVDFGFVGDVDRCDGSRLAGLLRQDIVPVVAPITHDGQGSLLNTNADTIASTVATALAPFYDVSLVYCFERPGVLRQPDDDSSVIPHIRKRDFPHLVDAGIVSGGMIPKIENALAACSEGVREVYITRVDQINRKDLGTRISLD